MKCISFRSQGRVGFGAIDGVIVEVEIDGIRTLSNGIVIKSSVAVSGDERR